MDKLQPKASIFAVRTTSGRELDVALIIERRVLEKRGKGEDLGITGIVVAPGVKGFVFVETLKPAELYKTLQNIKYASTSRPLKIPLQDVLNMLKPKEVVEEVAVGEEVEIMRGPFRGMRARVVSVDKSKNTLTVNLLEAAFSIPITISINYVKKVTRGG
ncbi:MAG: transcription elongation factor Spt5 [Desulfurococcaceae archaeon]